ncbi:MAG: UDP-N-acetylmuramate--L-alanine ligase [Anaerolineae bacterium]|nr:UDP-N-acetylmuramate--L-alanine ligase [Anaerolineae bacterium]
MSEHVHLIGIGGSGLSAIARVMLERGWRVSGSDRVISPLAKELESVGVTVMEGHQAANIAGADLVIRSSAIPDDNPEVVAAEAAGIPVLKRSQFLGKLTESHRTVAIAGTHGKTTTTAMMAWIFTQLGLDPSFIIGGVSKDLGTNAHAGTGEFFVVEADEYDHMFLALKPELAVITTMEHDHPDCFPTAQSYIDEFGAFLQQVKPNGHILICQDQPILHMLTPFIRGEVHRLTFGRGDGADYHASSPEPNALGGFSFSVVNQNQTLCRVALQVPGMHNVENAVACLAVVHLLGYSMTKAAEALRSFRGTGRRFDILGTVNGITIIDDYAHHPTEIKGTLAAARSRYPGQRIWAVWQPHTYSRTLSLFEGFMDAFSDADRVVVTEIYAARETEATINGGEVTRHMRHDNARFAPNHEFAVNLLTQKLEAGDVLLVLSAGDADQISAAVFEALRNSSDRMEGMNHS